MELPLGVWHFQLDYIQFYRIDFILLREFHTRYGMVKISIEIAFLGRLLLDSFLVDLLIKKRLVYIKNRVE